MGNPTNVVVVGRRTAGRLSRRTGICAQLLRIIELIEDPLACDRDIWGPFEACFPLTVCVSLAIFPVCLDVGTRVMVYSGVVG